MNFPSITLSNVSLFALAIIVSVVVVVRYSGGLEP